MTTKKTEARRHWLVRNFPVELRVQFQATAKMKGLKWSDVLEGMLRDWITIKPIPTKSEGER